MARKFEDTSRRCPKCNGAMNFEVDVEPLLGGHVDRTEIGYNCLDPECGKRMFP